MDGWLLSDGDLRDWLAALVSSGSRLVAPVEEDGLTVFRAVDSAEAVSLDGYSTSRWSPKEALFPGTETLFSYRLESDGVALETPPAGEEEQVLFAVRPCDAAGLARLDEMFLTDTEDSLYASRRARTATVSLACESARPECFCTAVGGSPAGADGSDLQLVSLGGEWLLRPLTEKGAALAGDASAGWAPASDEHLARAEEQRLAVEASIGATAVPAGWAGLLEGAFEHPLWELLGERCLGCGICAYVCPSCSCFDVGDEGSAFCGTRCRIWDSCSFAQFTSHASGHNPRPTQPDRYRQRVLHKFSYFPLEHDGRFMCVGCGRCLKLCPVGLDIRRSVELVAAGSEGA